LNQEIKGKTKIYPLPSTEPTCGLFLHAAAVLGSKGVILLMGHSSSGKTTLTSLISPHFQIIADDQVFAFPCLNGTWAVVDAQGLKTENGFDLYHSTEYLYEVGGIYALHSLMRIFAAEKTELQPLSPIKICEYLMDAVFEVSIQARNNSPVEQKQWFHTAASIARQYPGWQLQFTLHSQHAVNAIGQII
jgi:hypothetical protein